jgi:PAS domain S-box-containing protein
MVRANPVRPDDHPDCERRASLQQRSSDVTDKYQRTVGPAGVNEIAIAGTPRTAALPETMEFHQWAMVSHNMPDHLDRNQVFDQIAEVAPSAMIMIGQDGRVVMMNAQAEILFGYKRKEVVGQLVDMLLPERFRGGHPALRTAFMPGPGSAPVAPGRDLHALRKDGCEFPVEISSSPIETADGLMVLSAIVDVSHLRQEEERIRASLREKHVLLGEIHHRVKNNLQIVCSLLGLQAARAGDPAVQDLLRDSQNRIHSMALIHQTLYGSDDFDRVDFALFIDTLLPALTRSYGIDPHHIAVRVDVEPVRLPIDIAVPCGLMVNELISNAMKHAFRNRRRGEVRIALTRQIGNEALLSVSDNGIGLPAHLDVRNTDTIGLQLVALLADQLDGEISIHRSGPTRISLRFPI